MAGSYSTLADSLFQEEVPQTARCNGKVLAVFSMLVGFGLVGAMLSGGARGEGQIVQEPITTLALPSMQSVKTSQSMQPRNGLFFMQPARPGQAMELARPSQSMLPASSAFQPIQTAQPLAGYRPQALPSRTMQGTMLQYGIDSSPLSELAITAIDATVHSDRKRDVSVMASKLDKATKAKLSKVVVQVAAKAESLKAASLPGASEPLGFWDPLGYTAKCTEGKLLFYREVELKHGRVAMLAALGMVVGEQFHPLFGGNIDVPAIFAFQETPLEKFWPAVVAAIAIPEIYSVFTFEEPGGKIGGGESWAMKTDVDREPGDLGFDPLGLKPKDPAEFLEMQNKELNNGRLAMIAAAGMIAQELATGQKLF